jgi:hypothetical protein
MTSTRIRKNLLGLTEPQSKPKEIRDLLTPDYYSKIDLHPVYQREIKWKLDAMNGFIGTVMNNGLVPGVIMYQLHPEDIVENQGKYKYEVVDGKHRLFTLNAFKSSSLQNVPLIKKPFIVHWCYEETDAAGNKHIQRVFYQDTPEVQNWYRDTYKSGIPYFLDSDEKEVFDNFTISITMIRSKLSLDDRMENFMSLQKGIPVRNSDLIKNKTSCKLMARFGENGYKEKMSEFLQHCTKEANNYWAHWATRCFLLFKQSKQEQSENEPVETFLKRDTAIKKAIENNHVELNPTAEEFEEFDEKFNVVIEFLRGQEGIKFNPTQIFAIVYHLCGTDNNIDIIATHMKEFSKDGHKKEHKSLWESSDNEKRKDYFNACLMELEDMTELAKLIEPRKKITSKQRKQVFEKAEVSGECDTCGTEITLDAFEVGHCLAHKLGGKTELDNLIPLCKDCNRRMGVKDPVVFKTQVLPYIVL